MTEQVQETEINIEEVAIEDEPIYYKPKTLNLVATLAGIFSWIVLLGFIVLAVGQFFVLQELGQGADWATLLANAQVKNWIYTNIATPVLSAVGLFFVLQGISVGLNVLLEIDFNIREQKN